jgi:hypothetical protein
MLLQGSMHEFTMTDVFALLAGQKATGNLELNAGEREGVIFFRDGFVSGSTASDEQLSGKLYFLLIDNCGLLPDEAKKLFARHPNDLAGVYREIIFRDILPAKELESFSVSVIQDIVCGFFFWRHGEYRFSLEHPMLGSIVSPAGIRLDPMQISMEAARRIDEWRRIQERIDADMVFAHSVTKSEVGGTPIDTDSGRPPSFEQLATPDETAYVKVDGIRPVKEIISTSCLTTFSGFSAFNNLLAAQRIRPVRHRSHPAFPGSRPFAERRHLKHSGRSKLLPFLLLNIGLIIAIVAAGSLFLHGFILSAIENDAAIIRDRLPSAEAAQTAEITYLLHKALNDNKSR